MKKLIALAACFAISVASAAWKNVGTVQVADVESLIKGVTKIGEFTGNQMIGMMAATTVAQLPFVELFGEGRDGVPFALQLFCDGDDFEYAVLYPIDKTQKEFLAEHPGKVGKDGVIKLAPDGDGDEDDARYVKFSADGKWVAMSDKPEQLPLALKCVKQASRPMKGALARIAVNKEEMKTLCGMLDKIKSEDQDGAGVKKLEEQLRDCESFAFSVVVDDRGLAFRGSFAAVKGSKLAKCGLKPLVENPFAFADKSALVAYAIAADCGQNSIELDVLRSVLAKYGLKTDFLAAEEKNGAVFCTLDIPAAVSYLKSVSNKLDKVEWKKLGEDLQKTCEGAVAYKVENPAMSGQFAVKGYETAVTPAERVALALPEIAGKRPYLLQVGSFYSLFLAVLPHVLKELDPKDRSAFAPVVAALPPPGKGGFVGAAWREKDAHRLVVRFSADEFKSFSAGFAAFAAYSAQQAQKQPKKASKKQAKKPAKQDKEQGKANGGSAK